MLRLGDVMNGLKLNFDWSTRIRVKTRYVRHSTIALQGCNQ